MNGIIEENPIIEMTFGEYIKKIRLDKNMSLRKLSSELGVDAGRWSRIENGKARPPIHIEENLRDLLWIDSYTWNMIERKWAALYLPECFHWLIDEKLYDDIYKFDDSLRKREQELIKLINEYKKKLEMV